MLITAHRAAGNIANFFVCLFVCLYDDKRVLRKNLNK